MPEFAFPRRTLEVFCAVHFGLRAEARVSLCLLGYDGSVRISDLRTCLSVTSCNGRPEVAAARALGWVYQEHNCGAIIIHVEGEWFARRLEAALDGSGDEIARFWLRPLAGQAEIIADRIDRPSTPRMAQVIAMAKSGQVQLEIDAAPGNSQAAETDPA